MPRYVIEREVPGAGQLSQRDLQAMSQRSARALRKLGPQIQWEHSYVSADRIHCIYIAENEELLREHARLGDFPINRIYQVGAVIDPTTAE